MAYRSANLIGMGGFLGFGQEIEPGHAYFFRVEQPWDNPELLDRLHTFNRVSYQHLREIVMEGIRTEDRKALTLLEMTGILGDAGRCVEEEDEQGLAELKADVEEVLGIHPHRLDVAAETARYVNPMDFLMLVYTDAGNIRSVKSGSDVTFFNIPPFADFSYMGKMGKEIHMNEGTHARIRGVEGGGIEVEDMESLYGTSVDGEMLNSGDSVYVPAGQGNVISFAPLALGFNSLALVVNE